MFVGGKQLLHEHVDAISITACSEILQGSQMRRNDGINNLSNEHYFGCLTDLKSNMSIVPIFFCCIDLQTSSIGRGIKGAQISWIGKWDGRNSGVLGCCKEETQMAIHASTKSCQHQTSISFEFVFDFFKSFLCRSPMDTRQHLVLEVDVFNMYNAGRGHGECQWTMDNTLSCFSMNKYSGK